ncbi:hypothetical protein GCM10017608_13860 [Agromyces luteolus]|uniref:DUF4232 domain-containing protein n=1 Tax=Agromyces luteolus TaxID=88373 RepID=A0A7C9HUS9_9MICO|nr:hypothetical protein [Agromyces luteolus]MUN07685.1 hypothetical protein [Agromyces luteolus]GLK27452.1 hypothetical protein GCM10017608_13860 [Agromyces luteolus]
MSTDRPAPGRLPASVYRRRRLMVLLGLVAVIVAIVLVFVRPGASQGDDVGATTPASATPSAPATDDATETDAAEPPPSEPAAEPAADGDPCRAEQITVEAVTDAAVYAAGEQPKLSVTITNTGSNSCVMDVGTAAQVFTVTSGADTYWTSTHCQVDPVNADVTIEPGTPVSSSEPITWDRTRSSADTCGGARTNVPAGGASYHLNVSVNGFESTTSKQFLLY